MVPNNERTITIKSLKRILVTTAVSAVAAGAFAGSASAADVVLPECGPNQEFKIKTDTFIYVCKNGDTKFKGSLLE